MKFTRSNCLDKFKSLAKLFLVQRPAVVKHICTTYKSNG